LRDTLRLLEPEDLLVIAGKRGLIPCDIEWIAKRIVKINYRDNPLQTSKQIREFTNRYTKAKRAVIDYIG
jgi:hypothetical protein